MKQLRGMCAVFALAGSLMATGLSAQDADRIWGRVITTDGEAHEGFIRWDRNEANWADLLDGSKDIPWEDPDAWLEALGARRHENRQAIEFMGIRISWDENDHYFPSTASSAIRFGHIERMTVVGRQAVELTLRSGETIELTGGSTDIGRDIRELIVIDPDRGEVEIEWRDLDEIDFREAPAGARARSPRLWGTVEDRNGDTHTGYISWDLDEVLEEDILDGEERGRDREIEFDRIATIERLDRRGSVVTFRDGSEMELRNSNDVDRGHRGVQISVPYLGQIEVEWAEFESIRFEAPPAATGLADFDGGYRLRGTVETEGGDVFTGRIRWDADEDWSWEMLSGEWRDVVYDIEFSKIDTIEKLSWHGSLITLRNGREIELENSNDIDEDNRGVFIETDSGEKVIVDWIDFARITFEHR